MSNISFYEQKFQITKDFLSIYAINQRFIEYGAVSVLNIKYEIMFVYTQ